MIEVGMTVRETGLYANDERGMGRVKSVGMAPKGLSALRTVYVVYADGSDDYYAPDEVEVIVRSAKIVKVPKTSRTPRLPKMTRPEKPGRMASVWDMTLFPIELVELIERANACTLELQLSHSSADGRANSIIDESTVFAYLKALVSNEGTLVKPDEERCWYDCYYFRAVDGVRHPINIKVAGDNGWNMGNLTPWVWALTDLTWDEMTAHNNRSGGKRGETSPEILFNKVMLSDRAVTRLGDDNGRDYFYIVYRKDTKQFVLLSLKTLGLVQENPANPYGQTRHTIAPVRRTPRETFNYLVGVRCRTVRKQIKKLDLDGVAALEALVG